MTRADLPAAARLHAAELPEGFLAQLGPRFLHRYLATFLDVPGAVALAVDGEHGGLGGFVVGSTRDGHHRAALRSHGRSLLLAGALALSVRPAVLLELLRTRAAAYARALVGSRRPPAAVAPGSGGAGRTAVLLNVAVAPGERGRGAGAALVRGLEQAAREDGCARVVLVSFGEKAFYDKLGWEQASQRTNARGQSVVSYRRVL